jgi:hypothetical protein
MKRNFIKPVGITAAVISGVALCAVSFSAISKENQPFYKAMDRVAGRYRGTMLANVEGNKLTCKGGLEIVRTGDKYQIVGGFAHPEKKFEANFNVPLELNGKEIVIENVKSKTIDIDRFANRTVSSMSFEVKNDQGIQRQTLSLVGEDLKIEFLNGKDESSLTSQGMISVRKVGK